MDRRDPAEPGGPGARARRELPTVVEAVVAADLGAPWIAALRRRAGGASPMKWGHVADFVTTGQGGEAGEVRAGLAAQALVVTDPMEVVRGLDLSLASAGRLVAPYALLLFSEFRAGPRPALHLPASHHLAALRNTLRDVVFRSTLDSSGLGLLCDHMAGVDGREVDGDVRGVSRRRADVMASVADGLGGSITKAAKLASKVTALTAPLVDPDHPGRARVDHATARSAHLRFGDPDASASLAALELVAERRLVVDAGHEDITALTATVRDLAEVHAREPFFEDREAAFAALRQARREAANERGPGASVMGGYVRAEDDRRALRLQVADAVSGWGRTLIATRGYRELAAIFRCVLHNGRPLTLDRAATLDRDVREHRALVAAHLARSG